MDLTATRLRSFGLVSVILIGSCGVPNARSDRTDCALARIGRFEDVGTQDTRYVLTRTWNEQVEELPAIGLVSRSRVIWLASCTSSAPTRRGVLRRRESQPILDTLRLWLDVTANKTLPAGKLRKAIRYVQNQWGQLTRFVHDGRIQEIDNNLCEQALRQVALGRKNWLFIGTDERGQSNAILMSLVSTCKAIGVNPGDYLRDVLVRLSVESDVERLTPLGWKRDQAAAQRAAEARQAIANVLRSFAPTPR